MRKLFPMLLLLAGLQMNAQRTIIWCGRLIDAVAADAQQNMTIIVQGGIIAGIENGFTAASPNDQTIDLKGKTVMPGWIDCHVHLSHETNPNVYLERFELNDADYAYQSVVF
ncbi:MAG TPA: amidohydrolase family protein, partial [Chitinophagaceae bacterium]